MIEEMGREVFSHLCHQEPARAWHFGGEALPLCARCTGVYAGAALAAMTLPLARFEPSRAVLWVHGAAMLQMAFFGLGLFEQPPALRMLSGLAFAAGTVYFLWLPIRGRAWPLRSEAATGYLVAIAAVLAGMQMIVRVDAAAVGTVVTALALLGVLTVPILAVTGALAVLVPRAGRDRA